MNINPYFLLNIENLKLMVIESVEQTTKHVKEDQHSEAMCLNRHSRDHKFKLHNAITMTLLSMGVGKQLETGWLEFDWNRRHHAQCCR